jgi:hypothetical protein
MTFCSRRAQRSCSNNQLPTHLLPADAVIHKRALHNQQVGPVHVCVAITLKQLPACVPSEGHFGHLQCRTARQQLGAQPRHRVLGFVSAPCSCVVLMPMAAPNVATCHRSALAPTQAPPASLPSAWCSHLVDVCDFLARQPQLLDLLLLTPHILRLQLLPRAVEHVALQAQQTWPASVTQQLNKPSAPVKQPKRVALASQQHLPWAWPVLLTCEGTGCIVGKGRTQKPAGSSSS